MKKQENKGRKEDEESNGKETEKKNGTKLDGRKETGERPPRVTRLQAKSLQETPSSNEKNQSRVDTANGSNTWNPASHGLL